MVCKESIIRQVDEREWQINCFGIETGKTMGKESWINGKYAFLFAKGNHIFETQTYLHLDMSAIHLIYAIVIIK